MVCLVSIGKHLSVSQWAETRTHFIGALFNFAVEYARRLKGTQEGLYFNGLNLVLVYAEEVNLLGENINTI
jgi:hypothetical protein